MAHFEAREGAPTADILDKETALALGGVFMAICRALGDDGAQIARDTLSRFAENPTINSMAARNTWAMIVDSARLTQAEAEAENAELDATSRPQLRLIIGGAA